MFVYEFVLLVLMHLKFGCNKKKVQTRVSSTYSIFNFIKYNIRTKKLATTYGNYFVVRIVFMTHSSFHNLAIVDASLSFIILSFPKMALTICIARNLNNAHPTGYSPLHPFRFVSSPPRNAIIGYLNFGWSV